MQVRAAACGHADCVSLLRHRNPEISQYLLAAAYESGPLAGHNALSIAAMNGHHRVVMDLLTEEPVADVHSGPFHGAALLLAAERGHGHVVDALLTHGCSPECHTATGRKSAMRQAIEGQQWLICAVRPLSHLCSTAAARPLPCNRTRANCCSHAPASDPPHRGVQLLAAYGASLEDCREAAHVLEVMACAIFLDLDAALDVLLDHCEDHHINRNATLEQGARRGRPVLV